MRECILGVDIGGTNIRVALLNHELEIVSKETALTSDFTNADEFFKQIREMVQRVDPDNKGGAIGIVLPAPWTAGKRTITDATNILFLENIDMNEWQKYFDGYPVYLENDVNVIALLESDRGASKASTNSVYITVSTGIGSGIIINNEIYHGANGYAGEIGSIIVSGQPLAKDDPLEYTLEKLCSGKALEGISMSLYGEGATAVDLFINYRNGEDKAEAVLSRWINDLTLGLAAVIQMMDPEVIVLGGPVILNHKWIIDLLKKEIQKKVLGRLAEKVKVVAAQYNNEPGLVGAAYYAMKQMKGE